MNFELISGRVFALKISPEQNEPVTRKYCSIFNRFTSIFKKYSPTS